MTCWLTEGKVMCLSAFSSHRSTIHVSLELKENTSSVFILPSVGGWGEADIWVFWMLQYPFLLPLKSLFAEFFWGMILGFVYGASRAGFYLLKLISKGQHFASNSKNRLLWSCCNLCVPVCKVPHTCVLHQPPDFHIKQDCSFFASQELDLIHQYSTVTHSLHFNGPVKFC